MKTSLSLRLVAAVLLAASQLSLPAANATETVEQKAARHDREVKEAETKINLLVKEFPLLTGPGWEERYGKFRAELAQVRSAPEFKRPLLPVPKSVPGVPSGPKTLAQIQAERRAAALGVMRQQADKVLAKHPELRDYISQHFQWHKRLFELQDQWPNNPKVRQLVRNRLEVVVVP